MKLTESAMSDLHLQLSELSRFMDSGWMTENPLRQSIKQAIAGSKWNTLGELLDELDDYLANDLDIDMGWDEEDGLEYVDGIREVIADLLRVFKPQVFNPLHNKPMMEANEIQSAAEQLTESVLLKLANIQESDRVFINSGKIDSLLNEAFGEAVGEAEISPSIDIAEEDPHASVMKAAEADEFSVENDLKIQAYDDYIAQLDAVEESLSTLYIKMQKCEQFGIEGLGQEGYPFGAPVSDIFKNVVQWVAKQKVTKAKRTGENP